MTTPDRARALDTATAELRAAHVLLADPQCDPSAAIVHLRRAWEAVAWLSRGEVPEDAANENLGSWLAPEHLALIPAREHAELKATLAAIWGHPMDVRPWAEAPAPANDLSRPRALLRHVRALRGLVRALDLQDRGRTPKTQLALRWGLRAAAWLGLATGLALLVTRPWQREHGPWRGAYYPNKLFEGAPDLRRHVDVKFDWSEGRPSETVLGDTFTARWDSCLVLDEDTEAAFSLVASESARLYVDGELTVDSWDKAWSQANGARAKLEPGRHHLRVEFRRVGRRQPSLRLVASFDPAKRPGPIPRGMLEFPGMDLDDDANPCAR